MLAATEIAAAPVLALMGLGVVVTIAGHIVKAKTMVAIGLAMLFLATAAMMIGAFVQYQSDPRDPRPGGNPQDSGF